MTRATLRDPSQQATLDRYGFVVIPFVDAGLLDRLRTLGEEVGVAPDDPGRALYFGFHSKDLDYKRTADRALRPVLDQRCAEVFDDHDTYLAMFITKWPGPDSGFGPHQDPTLVDERRFRGVTIWTPLVATDRAGGVDNGVLHVVPGSHRFVAGARERNIDVSPFSHLHDEIVRRHGVAVPTRPGEAIVFDNRLIHYSLPNASERPRPVVSLGLRPAEASCVLPRTRPDGAVDLIEVDDSSWIEMVAATVFRWEPDQPPAATMPAATDTVVTPELLAAWCAAVGPAPSTEPATPVPAHDDAAPMVPGLFCAFCGSTEGLEWDDRGGRTNSQLMCERCESEAYDGGPIRAAAEPTRWDAAAFPVRRADDLRPALRDAAADRCLRRDGYVRLPLIGPDIVGRLRTAFDALHPWTGEGFEADLTVDDPDYRFAVRDAIGGELDDLVGGLFVDHTPFLRNFLCKWPGPGSDLYLHQDWMYVDERSGASTYVVWVALEDVDERNGQLSVLPGSHLVDRSLRGTDLTADWIGHGEAVEPRMVPVSARAGECVVLDNALVHRSAENTSDRRRLVAAVGVRPSSSPLVYFRRSGPDRAARYHVDEAFFCTTTPAALHAAPPDLPVAEWVDATSLALDASSLAARLDEATGRVPATASPVTVDGPPDGTAHPAPWRARLSRVRRMARSIR